MPVLPILVPLAMLLAALVVARPWITHGTGGKILAFVGLLVLPVVLLAGGVNDHMERSKTTQFCRSCHVMEPYYESLFVDESRHLPAAHYQNRRIPREKACFTCHTRYTMFGDLAAKLDGLQHLWVYYFGQIPEKIELYRPYNDRECLHCHAGSRAYEENLKHAEFREQLANNELRCFSCHFLKHSVHELDKLPRWTPTEDR